MNSKCVHLKFLAQGANDVFRKPRWHAIKCFQDNDWAICPTICLERAKRPEKAIVRPSLPCTHWAPLRCLVQKPRVLSVDRSRGVALCRQKQRRLRVCPSPCRNSAKRPAARITNKLIVGPNEYGCQIAQNLRTQKMYLDTSF